MTFDVRSHLTELTEEVVDLRSQLEAKKSRAELLERQLDDERRLSERLQRQLAVWNPVPLDFPLIDISSSSFDFCPVGRGRRAAPGRRATGREERPVRASGTAIEGNIFHLELNFLGRSSWNGNFERFYRVVAKRHPRCFTEHVLVQADAEELRSAREELSRNASTVEILIEEKNDLSIGQNQLRSQVDLETTLWNTTGQIDWHGTKRVASTRLQVGALEHQLAVEQAKAKDLIDRAEAAEEAHRRSEATVAALQLQLQQSAEQLRSKRFSSTSIGSIGFRRILRDAEGSSFVDSFLQSRAEELLAEGALELQELRMRHAHQTSELGQRDLLVKELQSQLELAQVHLQQVFYRVSWTFSRFYWVLLFIFWADEERRRRDGAGRRRRFGRRTGRAAGEPGRETGTGDAGTPRTVDQGGTGFRDSLKDDWWRRYCSYLKGIE